MTETTNIDDNNNSNGTTNATDNKTDNNANSEQQNGAEPEPSKDYSELHKQALIHKEEGNKLYGEGKLEEAVEEYTQSIVIMEGGHSLYPQDCAVFFSNRAACYVSMSRHEDVIKDCTSAIALSPSYAKALLRRANAYEATNQLYKALTGSIDTHNDIEFNISCRFRGVIQDRSNIESGN